METQQKLTLDVWIFRCKSALPSIPFFLFSKEARLTHLVKNIRVDLMARKRNHPKIGQTYRFL